MDKASLTHCAPPLYPIQLFYSFFKTLKGKTVIVELKNNVCIEGTLEAVDQYLNLRLSSIRITEEAKYPHMVRNPEISRLCPEI